MNTRWNAVLGAAVLALALVATADAAPKLKPVKSRTHHVRAAAVTAVASTPAVAGCTGPCSMGSCATKPGSNRQASASGQACPVTDPSACPSSCPRDRATASAVAANNR